MDDTGTSVRKKDYEREHDIPSSKRGINLSPDRHASDKIMHTKTTKTNPATPMARIAIPH